MLCESRLTGHSWGLRRLWPAGLGAKAVDPFLVLLSSDAPLKFWASVASVLEITWIQLFFPVPGRRYHSDWPVCHEVTKPVPEFPCYLSLKVFWRPLSQLPMGPGYFLFLPLVGLTINLESQPSGISFRWCAAFLPAALGTETRRRLSVWRLCSASVLSSHSTPTPPPQNVFHYLLFCNQSCTTSQECKMLPWVLVADIRYSLRSDDKCCKATWHGLFKDNK